MVARTSSWKGSPETLQRWAEHAESHVKPFVAGLPGNIGAVFLADPESGTGLTLTLWESEEAAAETDRNAAEPVEHGRGDGDRARRARAVAGRGAPVSKRGSV